MLTVLPQKIAQTTRFDDGLEDLPTRQTYTSTETHTKISEDVLADLFRIGNEIANATLKATLQRGTRSAILPNIRRFRADRQYGVKRLKGKYFTNTIWGDSKSLRSNDSTKIYIHKCGFNTVPHMNKENNENIGYSLGAFIIEYVVPGHLTYDGAAVQVGSKTIFQNHVSKHEIQT